VCTLGFMGRSVSVRVGETGEVSAGEQFVKDVEHCRTPIFVELIYVRYLADINLREQSFKVAAGFDLTWRASPEDLKNWEKSPTTFVPSFIPLFEVPNAKEEIIDDRPQENGNPFKIVERDDEQRVFLRRLVYYTCLERYEVVNWPFDVQELTMIINIPFHRTDRTMFSPPLNVLNGEEAKQPFLKVNRQYCALAEYTISRVVTEFTSQNRWSRMTIRFQAVRQASGYMWRLSFLSFLLGLTSLMVFTYDPIEEKSERLGYLITLVLAEVAFALIISNELPQVPYLTYMEKLNLAIFAFTVLLLVAVGFIGSDFVSDDPDVKSEINTFAAIASTTIFLVICMGFTGYGWFLRQREMSKLRMGMQKLNEWNSDPNDSPLWMTGIEPLNEAQRFAATDKPGPFLTFENDKE